jgi:hypothetical protein
MVAGCGHRVDQRGVSTKLLIPTASALALLAVLGAASATTYTVLPDGSGDYPTIEAAIDVSVNGDVIELANGTFRGPGNRDIQVHEKLITIRSQSGDPSTCIIDCEGSVAEHHGGFVFYSDVLLEGVTVCNSYREYGTGAVCVISDGVVRDCVFRNNGGNEHDHAHR